MKAKSLRRGQLFVHEGRTWKVVDNYPDFQDKSWRIVVAYPGDMPRGATDATPIYVPQSHQFEGEVR